jgi:acetyl-CoA decarbonylase/synthase complex subunit gamma
MALSGIEIFKLLPKTNCGDCGVPTCLAFAMSLAAGRSDLSRCPHIDKDSKTRLEEASAPPIRPVTIGSDAGLFKTGGETVLFRHEKRFENPTGIACLLTDSMPQNHIQQQLQQFGRLRYERAGEQLRAQLIAIRYQSGQEENYLNLVRSTDQIADASLILMCPDPVVLEKALRLCHRNKPLIHAATTANYHQVVPLALEFNCPLAIRADNVKALAELCQTVLLLGVKELILDSGAKTVKQALEDQVLIRRSAILSKYRPLGFPTICSLLK